MLLYSPCRYPELLAAGRQAASDAGVRPAFIELWASDTSALLPRLDDDWLRLDADVPADALAYLA